MGNRTKSWSYWRRSRCIRHLAVLLATALGVGACQHLERPPCDEARAIAAVRAHPSFESGFIDEPTVLDSTKDAQGKTHWGINFDWIPKDIPHTGGGKDFCVNRRTCRVTKVILWQ